MLSTLLLLVMLSGAEAPNGAQAEVPSLAAGRLKTPASFTLGASFRLGPVVQLTGQRGGFLVGRGNLARSREAEPRVSCPIQTLVADAEADASAVRAGDPATDGMIVRNDVASCLK